MLRRLYERTPARPFPPAAHRQSLTVAQLADLYVAAFRGRDCSRLHYLRDWVDCLGDHPVHALDGDLVADTLDAWFAEPARRFLGRDRVTHAPRWKDLGLAPQAVELQP